MAAFHPSKVFKKIYNSPESSFIPQAYLSLITMSHLFAQFFLFMSFDFLAVRFLTVSHFNHPPLGFRN